MKGYRDKVLAIARVIVGIPCQRNVNCLFFFEKPHPIRVLYWERKLAE